MRRVAAEGAYRASAASGPGSAVTTSTQALRASRAQVEGRFKEQIVPVEIKARKGVELFDTDEHVKGNTTNGGLNIKLAGTRWEGKGLDVSTTNGGITWELPKDYSAQLYTSTNIGGISGDLPVTKTGMLSKEVTASLGQGGAQVKAVTTNGGIKVNRQ